MKLPGEAPSVAYFCAEFGIDSNLPTYAGGLGVLAGDTLLEASVSDFPMIGVGLLYQGKYFIQRIHDDGWQSYEPSLFRRDDTACLRQVENYGKPIKVVIKVGDKDVWLKAYQQRLSDNTKLLLMTTDLDENPEEVREYLSADYWGDEEMQLRHLTILGVGGMKFLDALKFKPTIYHFNEGRPIFAHWEIVKQIMLKKKLSFEEASVQAREQIVYTNHTLIAAGNVTYDTGRVKFFAESYAQEMGVSVDELVAPGLESDGRFGITRYAINVSKIAQSVSKPHHQLARKEWKDYKWVSVTNGVHLPRWQHYDFHNVTLSLADIWANHLKRKNSLMHEVHVRTGYMYNPDWLVLGWARRISDYKHLDTLFSDIDRLTWILKNRDKPVLLLIAGKAHYGDEHAKTVVQMAINYMKGPLLEHAIYVHNYDLDLAREMVAGVDVWLNTPEYGKEACGTSGMKALANGVLNCTVADGWAKEVDWDGIGWVLDHKNMNESFLNTLENEIVPAYYDRDVEGLPRTWSLMMQQSIALANKYSTERMLAEYIKKLYS